MATTLPSQALAGQITSVTHELFGAARAGESRPQKSAQMQRQEESFDRIISGIDLTNPVDGKQREVWMGTGTSHWINGLYEIVDSPTQPGMGFHKLKTRL